MIEWNRLILDTPSTSEMLRYGGTRTWQERRPIVVWNTTFRCNLNCLHCYAQSQNKSYLGELTTQEAKAMISDLSDFNIPVLLFSGGEPLMRNDIFELADFAVKSGLKIALSTNGTLITEKIASKIKEAGFTYIGISLDGIGETNDKFRGQKGAFDLALNGIHHCQQTGIKTGIRFTINKYNYHELSAILGLVKEKNIERCCIYHLVYAGRGSHLIDKDISRKESMQAAEVIFNWVMGNGSKYPEILTVDNHVDGVFLYLRLKQTDPEKAEQVFNLLATNGGNSSGIGIGCIDNLGEVHADQFWQHYSFGNMRQQRFSDIWMDVSNELMRGLKERKGLLKGRCSQCKYLTLCNGNMRSRAEAVYGDVWASDPACYLTDEEIGVTLQP